ATVGARAPGNLAIAVIDNEAYGETGGQASHTAHGIDLAAVALACRFRNATTIRRRDELEALREMLLDASGPVLGVIKTAAADVPRVLPIRDGHAIRTRFRASVVG
ncbi:MAG: aldehyde dehydrogenase, partial [Burkholderiales bacterium]|nr:aldehyde dehydrogenase [Burkholderiales bacterium]